MSQTIDEDDIQYIRQGLMEFLCKITRSNTRQNDPIDFEIEQIREEKFPAISNQDHFTRIVTIISERFIDIELRGSLFRLSPTGLKNCEQYIVNFQHDF